MEIKITLFITLLLYAAVISQSFFYMLAMSNVMKNMQATSYIEARHLLDRNLRNSLTGVYYSALLSSIALTAFSVTNPKGLLFICSIIALIALIIDVLLTLKGNKPLNRTINTWTASNYPSNWKQYRSKWFAFYSARQVINLTGFIVLLAGMIFGM